MGQRKEGRQEFYIIFFFYKRRNDAYQIKQLVCVHETDTNRYSLSNAARIKE